MPALAQVKRQQKSERQPVIVSMSANASGTPGAPRPKEPNKEAMEARQIPTSSEETEEEVAYPAAMCRLNLVARATYWQNPMVKVSMAQPVKVQPVGLAKEELDQPLRPLLLRTPSQVPRIPTNAWACGTSIVGGGCQ